MTEIYCGGKMKVPSGKRRGTAKECVDSNRYSYWGVKKLDSRLLDKKNRGNEIASTVSSLLGQAGKVKGTINRLDKELIPHAAVIFPIPVGRDAVGGKVFGAVAANERFVLSANGEDPVDVVYPTYWPGLVAKNRRRLAVRRKAFVKLPCEV